MTKHSRNKVALVGTAWAALFVLCLVALFWVMVPVNVSRAAKMEHPPMLARVNSVLNDPSIVFTDTLESNNNLVQRHLFLPFFAVRQLRRKKLET